MKIITGIAKGMNLETLEGEATRPTSQRVKEAIFSMLRFELEGRTVLDLFAGSGQIGLEAISCGAATAVLCDKARDAVAVIEKNVDKAHMNEQCTVICADYAECIRRMEAQGKKFDLVFIDPPYASALVFEALTCLLKHGLLKPTSLLVCESGSELCLDGDLANAFDVIKRTRYGVAYVTILQPTKEKEK